MRIFVDTNIVISSILFPKGKVASVFSYILDNHTVIISSYTIEECKEVFKRKFPEDGKKLNKFLKSIKYELYKTPKKIDESKYPTIRDIKDLPILVSAILSDSDVMITGDKDFDEIKIDKPLIFTPNKYYELIDRKSN
ncbi:MAG TPA: putative toxin-antitoxin system toxin component, PIN family [Treponema sp.]|nr:putative toxin-antitoxin system toxin component, PIN family [Treponema sp.]